MRYAILDSRYAICYRCYFATAVSCHVGQIRAVAKSHIENRISHINDTVKYCVIHQLFYQTLP